MTPRSEGGAPRARQTILVADDDDAVLTLVRRILEAQGYAVVTAGGGEEALAALEARGPGFDLLITDVFMPNLNGPDLVRAARRTDPELAVLFMSGNLTADHPELESIRKGPAIAKPFSGRELLREIRHLLLEPATYSG